VTFTTLRDCLPLVPAVAAGLALGEALHGRTSERAFRIAVFSGLLFVGVVLAVRA
jgi:uncharacterized membrane protein YfcA